jgi:hypothetical protein
MPKPVTPTASVIDRDNQFDFSFEEFIKWASDGEYVYVKRVFENGQRLFCRFDINDPGENETPITRQAYAAVRSAEFRR